MTRAQAGQAGNLTKRQQVVFEFIKGYIQTHGVSPSYEEIRRNFGFGSYNSVQKHLKSLVAKGFLKTPWDNQKRALTLVEPGPATAILPLLGRVAAGRPIEAIAHPETVEVPEMLLRGEDNFALRVVGDSMVDEGIRDGDIVIVPDRRRRHHQAVLPPRHARRAAPGQRARVVDHGGRGGPAGAGDRGRADPEVSSVRDVRCAPSMP